LSDLAEILHMWTWKQINRWKPGFVYCLHHNHDNVSMSTAGGPATELVS